MSIYVVQRDGHDVQAAYTDPLLAEKCMEIFQGFQRFNIFRVVEVRLDEPLPTIEVAWKATIYLEREDVLKNLSYNVEERLFFESDPDWLAEWQDEEETVISISTKLGRDHLLELARRACDGEDLCRSEISDDPAGDDSGGGTGEGDAPHLMLHQNVQGCRTDREGA